MKKKIKQNLIKSIQLGALNVWLSWSNFYMFSKKVLLSINTGSILDISIRYKSPVPIGKVDAQSRSKVISHFIVSD